MTEEELPRKGNTRDQIIQSAYRLFLENGFHGTSTRQIAESAGIALGGIYNHFSSKEEIFSNVFMELHPYPEVLSQMINAQGDTLEAYVRDAARRFIGSIQERSEGFLKLLFIEIVEFNARHVPQLFERMLPQLFVFGQRLFADRAELRDLPPMVIVRAFYGLFFSYFMTDWLMADQMPPEARENALDHFVDIYLHGILKPGAAEEVS